MSSFFQGGARWSNIAFTAALVARILAPMPAVSQLEQLLVSGTACTDGVDNDFDGKVDSADPDCDRTNFQTENSPLKLSINLEPFTYYTRSLPFVDAMKVTHHKWTKTKTSWDEGVYSGPTDENGYPLQWPDGSAPEGTVLRTWAFLHNGSNYPEGIYTVIFEGSGTVRIKGGGSGTFSTPHTPHQVKVTKNPNGILIEIVRSELSDHIRNIRVLMPGHADTAAARPFNPAYVERLKPFKILRFMDVMRTNEQTLEHWDERTTATYFTQTGIRGPAPEYMIDLANEVGADPWFSMPPRADDNYVRRFAELVRQRLRPDRNVYVEYGNEIWNYGPGFWESWNYVNELAKQHGVSLSVETADQAARDWAIWKDVFGNDSARVKRVAAGQASVPGVLNSMVERLIADHADGGFDIISVAPYFNQQGSCKSIELDTLAAAFVRGARSAGRSSTYSDMARSLSARLKRPIEIIHYESGQHLTAAGNEKDACLPGIIDVQRHPLAYTGYRQYLRGMELRGINGAALYNFVGAFTAWGSWGHLEYLDQSLSDAPKFRALMDYIQEPSSASKSSLNPPVLSDISVAGLRTAGIAAEWKVSEESDGAVWLAEEESAGKWYTQTEGRSQHSIIITGLKMDTEYRYRVRSRSYVTGKTSTSAQGRVRTSAPSHVSVVDDTDPGFSIADASMVGKENSKSAYKGSFRYSGETNQGSGVASWEFAVQKGRMYRVFVSCGLTSVTWHGSAAAKYSVVDGEVEVQNVTFDQKTSNQKLKECTLYDRHDDGNGPRWIGWMALGDPVIPASNTLKIRNDKKLSSNRATWDAIRIQEWFPDDERLSPNAPTGLRLQD